MSEETKTELIIQIILPILGVIMIPITAAAKTVFYHSLNTSLKNNTATYKGSAFYSVVKLVNIAVKIAVCAGFVTLLVLPDSETSFEKVALISAIIITFALGIADNILEVVFVFGLKMTAIAASEGFCPYCGAQQYSQEASFCVKCGKKIR